MAPAPAAAGMSSAKAGVTREGCRGAGEPAGEVALAGAEAASPSFCLRSFLPSFSDEGTQGRGKEGSV
jgi:hypothetical protein